MRHWSLVVLATVLWIVSLVFPDASLAQSPMPTPVVLESDTIERVLQDFLDPCRAIFSYYRELGYDPTTADPMTRGVRQRSWDLLALALAHVAAHPEVAQDPVGLRSQMRHLVTRGLRERIFPGGDEARTLADGLDAAVSRWQNGTYTQEEAPGLALVTVVLAQPGYAEVYRASVEHAAAGSPGGIIRSALTPAALPPSCS